ncbi:hypothetical protein [Gulosibacter sp. 10]|uniref:hypothetical protein n=1 Tax=Gulosibacter sp. 10 TaxID=1255570 RepID=UPI00097F3D5B|nr:hypothetical protein [Gulosibacter sp. 10]SJM51202.1 hypothetical protein FM112_01835 [Gulosibacter sp. 10]
MANTDRQDYVDIPPTEVEAPDSHGKFSLNEDWWATIVGTALVLLCLGGIIPNIGGWF